MILSKWKWGAFLTLVLGLAAGGVWFLFLEEPLPAPLTLDKLAVRGERAPAEATGEVPDGRDIEAEVRAPQAPIVWPEGAVPGELVLSFETRSDLERFLRDAKRAGLTDIDVIPALGLVRVRTKDDYETRLAWSLAGGAGVSFNPIVAAPDVPPLDGVGGRYLAFGDQALAWMGVPDDNSDWGKGVRIAVLDTGVGAHPSLANASITHMSVLEAEAMLAGVGSHGTAVASLLAGQGDVRGVAPGADILSVQVLSADGSGSGFDLAMGIMAAVDGGANFINLSLGTQTDSAILRAAVKYAQDRGVTLVAAAGNEGAGKLMYPSAYPNVVSVGSVDANGQQVPFSNRGQTLVVTAPGYGLQVAGPEGDVIVVNGTSFSAPQVTGILAYLSQTMSATEAVQLLQDYANDGGLPGGDPHYGEGMVNLERIELRNVPGIHDVAVADHYLDLSGETPRMLITVQNRGTEPVGNIALEVVVNGELRRIPLDALAVGESTAGTISLTELLQGTDGIKIISRVVVPGLPDVRPDNDIKGTQLKSDDPAN